MRLIAYPDSELMMMDLADTIAGELSACLLTHDHASLAVPGGTTPGPIFDSLSAADLDWERVHVMLTDERWVPDAHPRSNTRLLRERLLTGRAARARHVPLWLPADRPDDVMDDLIAGVRPELPLSILLLGMGADMHTASLFPGADGLAAALADDAAPVMALRGPEPGGTGRPAGAADGDSGEWRVTLTGPVLRGAMATHVVITGDDKRTALDRAARLKPLEAPIATVLRDATVHWAPSD